MSLNPKKENNASFGQINVLNMFVKHVCEVLASLYLKSCITVTYSKSVI